MQRSFTIPLLICAFVYAPLAYAQDGTEGVIATSSDTEIASTTEATSTSETTPRIIEDGGLTERIEEHRAAFKTKVQERVYNLMQNIAGRMRAASARMANIADRMDARATILAQQGRDTSAARPYIESARRSLEQADGLMSEDLGLFAYSENAGGAFPGVRDRVYAIGQHIRDARESLRGGIRTLKDAGAGDSAEEQIATSTEGLEVQ